MGQYGIHDPTLQKVTEIGDGNWQDEIIRSIACVYFKSNLA